MENESYLIFIFHLCHLYRLCDIKINVKCRYIVELLVSWLLFVLLLSSSCNYSPVFFQSINLSVHI